MATDAQAFEARMLGDIIRAERNITKAAQRAYNNAYILIEASVFAGWSPPERPGTPIVAAISLERLDEIKAILTRNLKAEVLPEVLKAFQAAYTRSQKRVSGFTGDIEGVGAETLEALKYAETASESLGLAADHMVEQFYNEINSLWQQALYQGPGFDATKAELDSYIEQRVLDAYKALTKADKEASRAKRVAAAMANAAVQAGQLAYYKKLESHYDGDGGPSYVKEWKSQEDAKVRPTHAVNPPNGQRVPLDGHFTVGKFFGLYPGDPLLGREAFGCRCYLSIKDGRKRADILAADRGVKNARNATDRNRRAKAKALGEVTKLTKELAEARTNELDADVILKLEKKLAEAHARAAAAISNEEGLRKDRIKARLEAGPSTADERNEYKKQLEREAKEYDDGKWYQEQYNDRQRLREENRARLETNEDADDIDALLEDDLGESYEERLEDLLRKIRDFPKKPEGTNRGVNRVLLSDIEEEFDEVERYLRAEGDDSDIDVSAFWRAKEAWEALQEQEWVDEWEQYDLENNYDIENSDYADTGDYTSGIETLEEKRAREQAEADAEADALAEELDEILEVVDSARESTKNANEARARRQREESTDQSEEERDRRRRGRTASVGERVLRVDFSDGFDRRLYDAIEHAGRKLRLQVRLGDESKRSKLNAYEGLMAGMMNMTPEEWADDIGGAILATMQAREARLALLEGGTAQGHSEGSEGHSDDSCECGN